MRSACLPQEASPQAPLQKEKLWILLPVYNEGSAPAELIHDLESRWHQSISSILVMDDGSTDESMALIQRQASPLVQIKRQTVNQGLGKVLELGITEILSQAPDDDIVIVMDADNTHPPQYISELLAALNHGADIAIASRYQPGSAVEGLSLIRQLLTNVASYLFQRSVGLPGVKDYTCGYRAYRVQTLREGKSRYGNQLITKPGFTCMAELLIRLGWLGATCQEIPFTLQYHRKTTLSKMSICRNSTETLKILYQLWQEQHCA